MARSGLEAKQLFRLVGLLFPVVFTGLGFGFNIAALLTRDWARRDFYPGNLSPPKYITPSYTLYRSPFVLCKADITNPTEDTTAVSVACQRYKPFGSGQTSCQLPSETNRTTAVTGDPRMCQQIHFSGNLIIAALACGTAALVLCLVLAFVFTLMATDQGAGAAKPATAAEGEAKTEENNDPEAEGAVETGGSFFHRLRRRPGRPLETPRENPILNLAIYTLLLFLVVSAACTILSQFYGVLGLIQSAPDNGLFASYPYGQATNRPTGDFGHSPWYQGKGLTVYASLGWLFSSFAAGSVGFSWLMHSR